MKKNLGGEEKSKHAHQNEILSFFLSFFLLLRLFCPQTTTIPSNNADKKVTLPQFEYCASAFCFDHDFWQACIRAMLSSLRVFKTAQETCHI